MLLVLHINADEDTPLATTLVQALAAAAHPVAWQQLDRLVAAGDAAPAVLLLASRAVRYRDLAARRRR